VKGFIVIVSLQFGGTTQETIPEMDTWLFNCINK